MKNELEYLKDRSLTIIEFLISKNKNSVLIAEIPSIIDQAYTKKDIKSLRTISRDTNAWAKGLPKNDIVELETLMKEKFGENLSGDKTTHTTIKKALKNGKVQDNESYRVIYEYLQDMSEHDKFYSKMGKLEMLLADYKF